MSLVTDPVLAANAGNDASEIRSTRVTVAVITYQRPLGLQRLLKTLSQQKQSAAIPFELHVLIVDNDGKASARGIVEEAARDLDLSIEYVVEATQGIPFARNKALDAVGDDVDLVAFVDDDEWVGEDWLTEMLRAYYDMKADCVWGPVIPVFPKGAKQIFVTSGIYGHENFPDRRKVPLAATNNVLFDIRFVRRAGLRFDERLVHSGGSCVRFFRLGDRAGMRIYLCATAQVYEEIPPSRLSWSWIIKRQYREGNSLVRADTLDSSFLRRLIWMIAGLLVSLSGLLMLLIFFWPRMWGRGLVWAFRGLGILGGSFGLVVREYAPARLSGERNIDKGSALPLSGES